MLPEVLPLIPLGLNTPVARPQSSQCCPQLCGHFPDGPLLSSPLATITCEYAFLMA